MGEQPSRQKECQAQGSEIGARLEHGWGQYGWSEGGTGDNTRDGFWDAYEGPDRVRFSRTL